MTAPTETLVERTLYLEGILEQLVGPRGEACRYEGDRCTAHDSALPCAVRMARQTLGIAAPESFEAIREEPRPRKQTAAQAEARMRAPDNVPITIPEGYAERPHIWSAEEGRWLPFAELPGQPGLFAELGRMAAPMSPPPDEPAPEPGAPEEPISDASAALTIFPEQGIARIGGRLFQLIPGEAAGTLTPGPEIQLGDQREALRRLLTAASTFETEQASPASTAQLLQAIVGWKQTRSA